MRYVPVTQQPYCCVPACLQMVLVRRGLPLLSQEEIGSHLGLTLPPDEHWLVPTAVCSETPPSPAGFGTDVSGHPINDFFRVCGYELTETYVAPDELPSDLAGWLAQQLTADRDVLACYNYRATWGDRGDNGHLNVVESISGSVVTLVEPSWLRPKFREIELDQLMVGLRRNAETTGSRGGFWVIDARS